MKTSIRYFAVMIILACSDVNASALTGDVTTCSRSNCNCFNTDQICTSRTADRPCKMEDSNGSALASCGYYCAQDAACKAEEAVQQQIQDKEKHIQEQIDHPVEQLNNSQNH